MPIIAANYVHIMLLLRHCNMHNMFSEHGPRKTVAEMKLYTKFQLIIGRTFSIVSLPRNLYYILIMVEAHEYAW